MSERFLAELADEVALAARRVDKRRRRARVLSVSAALVVVTLTVGLLGSNQDAAATVDVSIVDGEFVVRLIDFESMPEEVEDAAAAEGLALEVSQVPVGPSNVGKFVGYETQGESPPEIRSIGAGFGESSFDGFALPASYSGTLHVLMGREAEENEAWHTSSDALSAGEVLACEPLLGRPLQLTLGELGTGRVDEIRVLALDEGRYLDKTEWAAWADAGVRRVLSPSRSSVTIIVSRAPDSIPSQPAPYGC